jgi:hypothetical protein
LTAEDVIESPVPQLIRIETAAMHKVLGQFFTGVAVVTAHTGRRSMGFTCRSGVDPDRLQMLLKVGSREAGVFANRRRVAQPRGVEVGVLLG